MPNTKKRPPIVDEELAKELAQYKGRWVAVNKGHVVGSGASASEAVEAALKVGVTDPLVFRVTAHPERLGLF